MQMKPLHRPLIRTLISGTIAVGALAVACSPRVATDLTGPKPTAARSTSKSTSPGATYFEFQVEKPVTVAAGSVAPVYPAEAKAAHVSGKVLVQFVVNEQGIPEANTLKILDSEHTDPVFATAVRQALPNMRFEAAQVGGKAVKQLVQQPFEFGVAKNTVTAGSLPSTSNGTSVRVKPASVAELASGTAPVTAPKSATQPYFEFQVERAVAFAPGTVGPAYPAALKAAKIEGQVLVQFVVDEDGIADVRSFKLLRLRAENNEVVHQEFVDAVLDALPNMRFIPAQVGGRNVKQLVQLPFQFSLSN